MKLLAKVSVRPTKKLLRKLFTILLPNNSKANFHYSTEQPHAFTSNLKLTNLTTLTDELFLLSAAPTRSFYRETWKYCDASAILLSVPSTPSTPKPLLEQAYFYEPFFLLLYFPIFSYFTFFKTLIQFNFNQVISYIYKNNDQL